MAKRKEGISQTSGTAALQTFGRTLVKHSDRDIGSESWTEVKLIFVLTMPAVQHTVQ